MSKWLRMKDVNDNVKFTEQTLRIGPEESIKSYQYKKKKYPLWNGNITNWKGI